MTAEAKNKGKNPNNKNNDIREQKGRKENLTFKSLKNKH